MVHIPMQQKANRLYKKIWRGRVGDYWWIQLKFDLQKKVKW